VVVITDTARAWFFYSVYTRTRKKYLLKSLAATVTNPVVLVTNPVVLNSSIEALMRYSLVDISNDAIETRLSIHSLVQVVIRDYLKKNE